MVLEKKSNIIESIEISSVMGQKRSKEVLKIFSQD